MQKLDKRQLKKLTFSCEAELIKQIKELSNITDIPYSRLIRQGIKLVIKQFNNKEDKSHTIKFTTEEISKINSFVLNTYEKEEPYDVEIEKNDLVTASIVETTDRYNNVIPPHRIVVGYAKSILRVVDKLNRSHN